MIPIAAPISLAMGIDAPLLFGAVISGAIFGDHCSPISDTTIVSSLAAECSVVEHVKTQLPYALLSGVIVSVLYFLVSLYI
jgi:Na+/H+ antiporter NhaC